MSLFGGPLPPQTPTANRRDESPYFRSSSPPPPSSPPSVLHVGHHSHARHSDPDHPDAADDADDDESGSEYYTDSDDESGSEYTNSDDESKRPRLHATSQAFNRDIEAERGITESIAKLRHEDLSLHLYDVYALKRRLVAERAAIKAETENPGPTDDGAAQWMPPRMWTAWPLAPRYVPRPSARFELRRTVDEDERTYCRYGHDRQRPIRDIKEILVGLVQKRARERWPAELWDEDNEPIPVVEEVEEAEEDGTDETDDDEVCSRGRAQLDADDWSRRRYTPPPGSRKEFIMDDEEAYGTLHETTRSIMQNLNDVLIAVQMDDRGRKSRRGTPGPASKRASRSRSTKGRKRGRSATGSEPPPKRPRGRPPKSASATPYVTDGEESKPQPKGRRSRPPKSGSATPAPSATPYVTEGEETSASTKSRSRGRPKKYNRLPGESYYMARKRLSSLAPSDGLLPDASAAGSNTVSRAQTSEPDPDPASSRPTTPNLLTAAATALAQRPRAPSVSSDDDSDSDGADWHKPSGGRVAPLLDWRDILDQVYLHGGFSEAVIARTTKRCVDLFGEEFTPPEAGGSAKSVKEEPVAEEDEDRPKTPVWQGTSYTCPHEDCDRYTQPYDKLWRLREHVKKKHKYTLDAPRAPRANSKRAKRLAEKQALKLEKATETGYDTDSDTSVLIDKATDRRKLGRGKGRRREITKEDRQREWIDFIDETKKKKVASQGTFQYQ